MTTKPPFAPAGTITAFLTRWAFIKPSTSVRKSSRRSDQRMPPRATLPDRKCTASTRGEYTNTSYTGRGNGRSGICAGSSFNTTHVGSWNQFVRSVAFTRWSSARKIRSSSRLVTASSCSMMSRARISGSSPPLVVIDHGSKRATNSSTRRRASSQCVDSVSSMYAWLNTVPVWRRYLQYARRSATSRQARPARSTRRLNPSSSARPSTTARNASSNDRSSAPPTFVPALGRMRNHLIQRGSSPSGIRVYGCSSSTITPMLARRGRTSESDGWAPAP